MPASTEPVSLVNSMTVSIFEITTGVNTDLALLSSKGRSISMIVSPILTCCPSSATRVKPSPFNSTVSIPKWTKSSIPSSDSIAKAWLVSKILPILPTDDNFFPF